MKVCSENRKLLAALALDELSGTAPMKLRAHMEQCAGCRCYFEEIATIYASQRAIIDNSPEIQSDSPIHQNVLARIKADQRTPFKEATNLHWTWPKWATAMASLAILAFCLLALWRPKKSDQTTIVTNPPGIEQPSAKPRDFQPSLADYRKRAGRSFDKLDSLLESEAQKKSGSAESLSISGLMQ